MGYTVWAPNTAAIASSQVPLQSSVQNEHIPDCGLKEETLRVSIKVLPDESRVISWED
jgi:hypothetical protein